MLKGCDLISEQEIPENIDQDYENVSYSIENVAF